MASHSHPAGAFPQCSQGLEHKSLLIGPGAQWEKGTRTSGWGVQIMVAACVMWTTEQTCTQVLVPLLSGWKPEHCFTSEGSTFTL